MVYVYVHVHVCVCTFKDVLTHVWMCGGQTSTLDVFSIALHLIFLRQGLSLNPELSILARLADRQAQYVFLSLPPQPWN